MVKTEPHSKKRKAADTKMWGSSTSTSSNSSSRRGNSKGAVGSGGGGSRRGGGGTSGLFGLSSSGSSAISESKAEKLFEELCDDDDPGAASMEGECWDNRNRFDVASPFLMGGIHPSFYTTLLLRQEYVNYANSSISILSRMCAFSSCSGRWAPTRSPRRSRRRSGWPRVTNCN
jgi:hypothetical protein